MRRLEFFAKTTGVLEIDVHVALQAAGVYMELLGHAKSMELGHKPSFVDAIVLAMARVLKASVVTVDLHIKGLKETIWLGD